MPTRIAIEYEADAETLRIYKLRPGDVSKTAITLPSGVTGLDLLPAFATQNGRLYICGTPSENLVFTENEELLRSGIEAPLTTPTLASSGSGTLTGQMIGYLTYVHKDDRGRVLVESNPTGPSNVLDASSIGSRVWSTLPSTDQQDLEDRATHIRGYLSIAGFLPRLAWEREVGTTTVTESMSAARLAQQVALPNDGVSVVLNRKRPPKAGVCAVYHRRMFYAGDPVFPYRLWYSELDEPEAVGDLSYWDTRDGETITGLAVWNDSLIVFCNRATYEFQGYDDGATTGTLDQELRKLIEGIGCISHQSIVDINDRLWFASEDGVRVYDGSFSYVMKNLHTFWRDDYKANIATYERSSAVVDRHWQTYNLLIPKTNAFYYIGYYHDTDPATGGDGRQPKWSFDTRNRQEQIVGTWSDSDGRNRWYAGDCKGRIRLSDDEDNDDDDGDLWGKRIIVRTKHYFFGGLSADVQEGIDPKELASYVESEEHPWTVRIYAGDESASDQLKPNWKDDVPASAKEYSLPDEGGTATAVALGRHHHRVFSASGSGVTLEYRIDTNVTAGWNGASGSWKFRGFGLSWGPGKKSRRPSSVS